jgi:hypothetical protein
MIPVGSPKQSVAPPVIAPAKVKNSSEDGAGASAPVCGTLQVAADQRDWSKAGLLWQSGVSQRAAKSFRERWGTIHARKLAAVAKGWMKL